MLKISAIRINNLESGCITDERPVISFSLESDHEGETLDYAIISCGDWNIKTTSQTSNVYGGEMHPFTTYTIHIAAVGSSGESAEGEAQFSTGRLDTKWDAKWISDTDYTWPPKTVACANGIP